MQNEPQRVGLVQSGPHHHLIENLKLINKGNNKITELRTILQRVFLAIL